MGQSMFTKKSIKEDKKGFYTVEAAIFLPIFILGILTIGYIVKIIGICENSNHAVTDEISYLAAQSYAVKTAPGFKPSLINRLEKENPDISQPEINKFRHLYSDGKMDQLITAQISYRIDIKLPLDFYDGVDVSGKWLTRGFVGTKSKWTAMPFSEMERNENSDTVWIFPDAGKRYHRKNCTYVTAHPVQTVLSDSIKSEYEACRLCDAGNLSKGSIVYCFMRYGESYHRSDCKTIEKYTVETERKEAIEKGYTPCSKCGGG